MANDEIIMIPARPCKRCGRLLTSADAVRDGYGCLCRQREEQEKYGLPQLPGQVSLLDESEVIE